MAAHSLLGTIVLYRVPANDLGQNPDQLLVPAIVTHVWSDTTVDLYAFYNSAASSHVTSSDQGEGEGQWHLPVAAVEE